MNEFRTKKNEGFTLVEMLVAVVVFGVLSAVVGSSTIRALQSSRNSEARMTSNQEVTRGAERLTRELRTALAVRDPLSPTSVTFENYVRGVRYLRSYELNPTTDVITERVAAYASPTSPVPTLPAGGQLLRGVVNDAGTPLLRYFDDKGNVATTAAKVERIEITLQAKPPESKSVLVRTSVNLRNA